MGRKIVDLIGLKVGRLTVVSLYTRDVNKTLWMCKCECGNSKIVSSSSLRSETVKSCGCLNDEGRIRGGKTRSKEKQMIGEKYGRLLVIERAPSPPKTHGYYYKCLCDCGNYSVTSGKSLLNGATKSCGCYGAEQRLNAVFVDLTGQKFGRWTVIKKVKNRGKAIFYLCRCVCGTEKEISGNSLKMGNSSSCGCYMRDKVDAYGDKFSFNDLYLGYKNSAKARNLEFNISKEFFKELTSSNCYYCNAPPELEHKRKSFQNRFYKFNGVDRLNNDLGYIENNIVPCCKNCNKAKQGMTEEEFLNWVEKIYQHLLKENII